jgi:hypothetical protein
VTKDHDKLRTLPSQLTKKKVRFKHLENISSASEKMSKAGLLRLNLIKYDNETKGNFDKREKIRVKEYKVGDWVLLNNKRLLVNRPSHLEPPYEGPYHICRKWGVSAYKLEMGTRKSKQS